MSVVGLPGRVPAVFETGVGPLDQELGGLPSRSTVQVHGPPGAGKSTLALSLARSLAPSVAILPERLHPKRVGHLLGDAAARVLVARPSDLEAQDAAVTKGADLLARGRVQGLVLDSLTFLYRFERLSDTAALRRVFAQLHLLHGAARDGEGLAIFTNQVRGGARGLKPIGGPGIGHVSDVILGLEVLEGPWRRLRLDKHPYEAPGKAWDVKIGGRGLFS